ncbi:MAG: DUF4381 domain-containing protein [Pseudomonadaceae bacterium]
MADSAIPPLHDLALPAAISAWPPAPFASTLLALLALLLLWHLLRQWQRYRQNAYRRHALRRLDLLQQACQQQPAMLLQLPALLRHTALQIWPREQVASLSGEHWLQRLAQQCNAPLPPELAELAYWPAARCAALDTQQRAQLFRACRHWISHHVRP